MHVCYVALMLLSFTFYALSSPTHNVDEDLLSLFGDVDNSSEGDDESLFDELAHIVQDLGIVNESRPLNETLKCITKSQLVAIEDIMQTCAKLANATHHINKTKEAEEEEEEEIAECVLQKIVPISKARDSIDLKHLVGSDGFIDGTTMTGAHKEEAKSELENCMKDDMPVPQSFVYEIMSDRDTNAQMLSQLIFKMMNNHELISARVEKVRGYFMGFKAMLCLAKSLLKHGC